MKLDKIRVVVYSVVLFFLFLSLCIYFNKGDIFANLGQFYYKRNNISKTIEYLEKSFSNGRNDLKLREIYVNSIINSPLRVEYQEKLVDIAQGKIQDNAQETALYFLHNLRKEINNKYPNNYIQQASYNNKVVHWGRLPITYTYKNIHGIPPEYIKEIDNAFNEWERMSSCRITFERENLGPSDIVIEFMTKKPESIEYGKKYVTAYTTPDIIQKKLRGMNIKFNIHEPSGEMFTPNQIYNTALHEIFHALGFMGHSENPDSIMYMTKDNFVLQNDERIRLNEADKKTLELLYKIRPNITNEEKIKYEYVPYLILGNEREVSESKIREANSYIRKAPNLPGGYIDLAESLANEGKYIDGIHNLEKALRLANDNDTKYIILYNIAVCYYKIEFYEMALGYVEQAEEINKTEELQFLKAEIYSKTLKTKEAIAEYTELIKKYPDNIDYTIQLTNIYVKKHKYLKARNVLKNYIKMHPKDKNSSLLKIYGILRF